MSDLETCTTEELRKMLHEKECFDLQEKVCEEVSHILFDRIAEATASGSFIP